MKPKFKDLANLYLGCKMESGHVLVGLQPENKSELQRPMLLALPNELDFISWEADWDMDRPILKPMSEITEEDFREFAKMESLSDKFSFVFETEDFFTAGKLDLVAKWIAFLCSKSFNVFGIPESEIATI